MLIARYPQLSPSRPLACGSLRGSPTTPCWPRLALLCSYGTHHQPFRVFSAHLSWHLIVAWRRMGERGCSFGGGACFPGPCSPIVPLAAPSRWLTVLPSSSPRHCGYSTPSLVTRRRRRVTYFAFPFGGRANGRVYRQCRQRPQRPREPCTVRLRRRQCYAHSHCQQRVRKRAAAARRTLAGCVCAARRTPA